MMCRFARTDAITLMMALYLCTAGGSEQLRLPFLVVGCVETSRAPTIDGRLTEDNWLQAGRATRFVLLNSDNQPREQTIVYLLHDRDC